MGVTGKLDLWTALRHTPLAERRDFDALIETCTASNCTTSTRPTPVVPQCSPELLKPTP
jgi:hypothetical protein